MQYDNPVLVDLLYFHERERERVGEVKSTRGIFGVNGGVSLGRQKRSANMWESERNE